MFLHAVFTCVCFCVCFFACVCFCVCVCFVVRLMFSNNFVSEGMGDLAANMSSFTTAVKQVHELIALLV